MAKTTGKQVQKKSDKEGVNEDMIENQTVGMFKKIKGTKDEKQIESLVQMQIEDQMNKIDDKNTMNEAINILEYGADLETKDYIGTDIND